MAIAYVRDLGKVRTTGASSSSASSFGALPAVGNAIVSVCNGFQGSATWTPDVTDNQGNAYSNAVTARDAINGFQVCRIAYAEIGVSAGSFTVTQTASNLGASYFTWSAIEFSGVKDSSPVDQIGTQAEGPGSTSITVNTAGNLTENDELVVSTVGLDSAVNHTSITASGYTSVYNEPDGTTYDAGAGAYKILSGGSGAGQSAAWSWTTNSGTAEVAVIATFKQPAAVGAIALMPQILM
jgi:hypothetical protein